MPAQVRRADAQDFTSGKIFGPFVRFALPVLLALFLQTLYGAVDLLIVGQFALSADVSAVSTGTQVMQTVTFVITGLAMGLTVCLGQKIGEKRADEAGEAVGAGVWLFAVIAVVTTAVMVLCARPVALTLRAPEEAFDRTVSYIAVCSGGMIFIVAYNLIGSVFRGIGDSKLPLITVAIATAVNVAGDLMLVAGFHMGAAGAAIATVFAQAVSVVLSLVIIRRRALPFDFSAKYVRPNKNYVKQIFRVGTPIALQDLLASISFLAILAIVNGLGVVASAGIGVAERLCGFIMLVPSAYMQSMSAFVAQNAGAEKPERAKKALLYGIVSALAIGVGMFALAFFDGENLASIFSPERDVIYAAADYLKAYAIDCMLTPFLFCFMGYFNGYGRTTFVMIQGLAGALAIRLPLSWVFSRIEPVTLFRIGAAIPIATTVQICLCLLYYARLSRVSGNVRQA